MSNRYSDALFITAGACNPVAIADKIHQALLEVVREPGYKGTQAQREDPAVRLMVHQLAFLVGVGEGAMPDAYTEAYAACMKLAEMPVTKSDIVKSVAEQAGVDVVDVPLEEWSGSPDPDDPDNFWIDDKTGERVDGHTGEREQG